ncbi:hypothetical protein HPB51_012074 [Rhipicephalus microplus]|uniref:Uncharacterized protein n=1 Tax=Rhipicephalus microplus TaxID=6941 RepID=A0A9J6EG18_RHIMP|nr:hypothetical protein HPB51_012074 [Rhipicephalus microplus]
MTDAVTNQPTPAQPAPPAVPSLCPCATHQRDPPIFSGSGAKATFGKGPSLIRLKTLSDRKSADNSPCCLIVTRPPQACFRHCRRPYAPTFVMRLVAKVLGCDPQVTGLNPGCGSCISDGGENVAMVTNTTIAPTAERLRELTADSDNLGAQDVLYVATTLENIVSAGTIEIQRRLSDLKMATVPCFVDVFEQLDDATRVEAYRLAVSEADILRTEVGQLRSKWEEPKLTTLKDSTPPQTTTHQNHLLTRR